MLKWGTKEPILLRLNRLYFFKRALAKKEKKKNDSTKLQLEHGYSACV